MRSMPYDLALVSLSFSEVFYDDESVFLLGKVPALSFLMLARMVLAFSSVFFFPIPSAASHQLGPGFGLIPFFIRCTGFICDQFVQIWCFFGGMKGGVIKKADLSLSIEPLSSKTSTTGGRLRSLLAFFQIMH